MAVVLIFTRRFALRSDVYIFLVMSMLFQCRLLHYFVMSILCVLLMNSAAILLSVVIWHILFSTSVRRSDVEPTNSWWLDFGVSFGMSVVQSYVELLGS